MDNQSLLQKMKEKLAAVKGRWPAIAIEAKVDYVWLFKVMQGRIKDPGVTRVERVISALNRMESTPDSKEPALQTNLVSEKSA